MPIVRAYTLTRLTLERSMRCKSLCCKLPMSSATSDVQSKVIVTLKISSLVVDGAA